MATVEKTIEKVQIVAPKTVEREFYTLKLDTYEAGYLKDLLNCRVAGELLMTGQPLGRILGALDDANVVRRHTVNLTEGGSGGNVGFKGYPYAVLGYRNDLDRGAVRDFYRSIEGAKASTVNSSAFAAYVTA